MSARSHGKAQPAQGPWPAASRLLGLEHSASRYITENHAIAMTAAIATAAKAIWTATLSIQP
jgi:hypothetical protein